MRDATFFSNFFVIEDPASKKSFRGKIFNDIGDFGQLRRFEFKVDKLMIRHLEGGQEPALLFWNQVCDPFCIKNDLLNILITNGVFGWSSIPITVEDKNGNLSENFSALTIHGRADAIDYLKSDIVFKQMPSGPSPSFKGLYFKPDSWDGSDLFMTRADEYGKATAHIYSTKKLKQVFKKAKISNIRFINFNDYEIWCPTITVGSNEIYRSLLEAKIAEASQ